MLIPVCTGSGNSSVARATYQGTASHALPVNAVYTLEATSRAAEGRDEMWFEPSPAQSARPWSPSSGTNAGAAPAVSVRPHA